VYVTPIMENADFTKKKINFASNTKSARPPPVLVIKQAENCIFCTKCNNVIFFLINYFCSKIIDRVMN